MDIAVGLPAKRTVLVFSGTDGKRLFALRGDSNEPGFGISLGHADVNLDGAADLLLGSLAGFAQVLSLAELSLAYTPHKLSIATGGTQILDLMAGKEHAGKSYMLLGSLSGIRPGIPLGALTLPLNPDFYLLFSLSYPNAPPLIQSTGFLDITGSAKAAFQLPRGLPKAMTGLSFHHAYVVFGWAFTIDRISNPAPLLLVD